MKLRSMQRAYGIFLLTIILVSMSLNDGHCSPEAIDSVTIAAQVDTVVTPPEAARKILSVPTEHWSLSFSKFFWATVLFFVSLIFFRYTTKLLIALSERWVNARLGIKRFIPIFRILGWTFVIYVIIAWIFSPPIETIIAVTASTGIAIGFASQDILKNIFGGIMILFDRPFQVGDKIEVGKYYGEVLNIGLRSVRIVTPDDSQVSIPNSDIVNQAVSNSNAGESNCQVVAEIFLPMDVDIARVKSIARETAATSRFVYINKPIAVLVKNEIHMGKSVMKLRLKAYVFDIRYEFQFMSDMTEILSRELKQNRIIVSMPTDMPPSVNPV